MLGGLVMLKKIITGTLVLIVMSTSSVVVYAGPQDEINIDLKQLDTNSKELNLEVQEEKKEEIQIISPQVSPEEEVIADKNLLISINVVGESPITLNVYKILKENEESEESEEALFDPQVIEPSEELEADFVKHIKDIEQGKYKMVFNKDGEEDPIKVIEFEVKKTEEVVNKEKKDALPDLLDLNITDLLLEE